MHLRSLAAAAAVSLTVVVAACSGGSSSSTSQPPVSSVPSTGSPTTSLAPGAVDPNAPEVVEPGDIPDNQVFIWFQPDGASFSLEVPEGWGRTDSGGVVTFTDKYNTVAVRSIAGPAPTVDSMRTSGLADVSSDPTFTLLDVQPVTRKAGDGVLATYEIGSAPNEVTGKKALLAVERYEFAHDGTTVVLTLSGAKGADNVDPWMTISNSLVWT